jgi:hypothetical protein
MATAQNLPRFTEELADFLASNPTRDQLLHFQPSERVRERARELIEKQGDGKISNDEQQELDQLVYYERLMRLVKARLRAAKASQP